MRVHGVVWVGTRTDAFDETVSFFRDILGVEFGFPAPDFAWSSMPNTSQLEIFGPSDRDHTHFTTGPVPEFLVDDLPSAIDELRAAGVAILGEPVVRGDEGWLHFRAPDGNVYGLTTGRSYRR
jgi:predicted enzyme related to lactoylglutathione lyase